MTSDFFNKVLIIVLYLYMLFVKCNIFFRFFGIHSSDARNKRKHIHVTSFRVGTVETALLESGQTIGSLVIGPVRVRGREQPPPRCTANGRAALRSSPL